MRVNCIEIEGFGSIRDKVRLDFNESGLLCIMAPNGTGKSTIINAINWVYYGKTANNKETVSTWDFLKNESYRGTRVYIKHTKDNKVFEIERYLDYHGSREVFGQKIRPKSGLFVCDNGVLPKESKKAEKQKIIDREVGLTQALFKNTILFGQNIIRFLKETGPTKKDLLDEAFDIGFVKIALQLAKDELDKLQSAYFNNKASLDKIVTNVANIKSKLELTLDQQRNFDTLKAERIEQLVERKEEKAAKLNLLETELAEINTKLEEKQAELDKLGKVDEDKYLKYIKNKAWYTAKRESRDKAIFELVKKIDKVTRDIEKVPTKCFNCGKPFDTNDTREQVDRLEMEKGKLTKELNKLKNHSTTDEENLKLDDKAFNKLKVKKANIDNILEKKRLLDKDALTLNNNIKNLKDTIKTLKSDIEAEKSKVFKLPSDFKEWGNILRDSKESMKPLERVIKKLSKDIEIYKWIINEPLSNSGIRPFLFSFMLEAINTELHKFSYWFNAEVSLSIDEDSKRKDIISTIKRANHVISEKDLSGGESQLTDLAVAFSIHNLVTKDADIGLFILDELFESLDSSNIELVSSFIQDISTNKLVILITHNSKFSPTNATEIKLVNKKGITSIEQ